MPDINDIRRIRLSRQLVERPTGAAPTDPAGVVAHLGAMQAQDYASSVWSIALRSAPETSADDVEQAIADRLIARTWMMRGTLHLLAPQDVRWMSSLLSPRAIARAEKRFAQLELTDDIFDRARTIFSEALTGGHSLARPDAMALLEADGIPTGEQHGYHILWRLAQDGVLCCGPMADKQQTFVLLDEWIPAGTTQQDSPSTEQALARLAEKYFTARGPATLADFAWWAGITKGEAREGLDAVVHRMESMSVHGSEYWLAAHGAEGGTGLSVHLLPGFDEYMLGYTDRTAQLGEHRRTYGSSVSANGMFAATVIIDGLVAGTWRRTIKADRVDVAIKTFRNLSEDETAELELAADHFGKFKGMPAVVHIESARG